MKWLVLLLVFCAPLAHAEQVFYFPGQVIRIFERHHQRDMVKAMDRREHGRTKWHARGLAGWFYNINGTVYFSRIRKIRGKLTCEKFAFLTRKTSGKINEKKFLQYLKEAPCS